MERLPNTGIIFNIQRFTIHDGPGIRTEFFLKGCPLRCVWCSNPESQNPEIQPGVYKTKCISHRKCSECTNACPFGEKALNFYRARLVSVDRDLCTNCMLCADACPSEAVKQWGERKTIEECMKEVRKDIGYYERSGGGVTLSGGDPLVQADFSAELMKACKEEGIHTCFESTFFGDWKEIEKIIPYADLFISDIKHMDPEIHKKYTGISNRKILENLKRLATETDIDIILRIPVIPNVNNDMGNIEATADFILNEMKGRVRTLQLLSFMRLGEEKYQSLGMPYNMKDVKINRRSFTKQVEKLSAYFNSRGINCLVGTKEK